MAKPIPAMGGTEMTQIDEKSLVTLQGLSDVEQRTVYLDYVTEQEILEVRRVLMNHVMNEEIHLAGFLFTVAFISTDIQLRNHYGYDGFTRKIYLRKRA